MVNKYVAMEWIKKVIVSCKTRHHIIACNKLLANFDILYEDYALHEHLWKVKRIQRTKIINARENII